MRILHTSDWHLGKRLFKAERLPEQELFLDWLIDYIHNNRIDVLIVAGDVFDVPTPPNNAQKLFYDFIFKLSQIEDLKTIIIGGNHDSTSLLQIPKSFFESSNCFIRSGLCDENERDIVIKKDGVSIGFKCLPYFRNFELLNKLRTSTDDSVDNELKEFFNEYFSSWKSSEKLSKKLLIAHHVFGNYEMSGSEHAIHLSGIDHFPLSWTKEHFDYLALGHIHKKMTLSDDPPTIYPGAPIPMRFSESNKKYISIIETDGDNLNYELIQIPVFRNIVQLKLTLEDYKEELASLIQDSESNELKTFLEIHMELDTPQTGLADTIRSILEKSNVELLSYFPVNKIERQQKTKSDNITNLTIDDLFSKYFHQKFPGEEPPKELINSFTELLEDIRNENP